MEPEDVYEKMDYEGGFWELVSHSGTDFLKGTPFEDKITLIEEAAQLADAISDYFESLSEEDEEDWDALDEDDDEGEEDWDVLDEDDDEGEEEE